MSFCTQNTEDTLNQLAQLKKNKYYLCAKSYIWIQNDLQKAILIIHASSIYTFLVQNFPTNIIWIMKIVHSASIEKTSLALPLTTEVALNDPDDYDNNIFEEKNKSMKWAMPQLKKKNTLHNQEPPFKPNLIESLLDFFPLYCWQLKICVIHTMCR